MPLGLGAVDRGAREGARQSLPSRRGWTMRGDAVTIVPLRINELARRGNESWPRKPRGGRGQACACSSSASRTVNLVRGPCYSAATKTRSDSCQAGRGRHHRNRKAARETQSINWPRAMDNVASRKFRVVGRQRSMLHGDGSFERQKPQCAVFAGIGCISAGAAGHSA